LIVVQNPGIIFNGESPRVIYAIHWVCLHVTGATSMLHFFFFGGDVLGIT